MINQESKSSQVIKYEYVLIKTVWNYSMSPFQISLLSYFYGAHVPIEPCKWIPMRNICFVSWTRDLNYNIEKTNRDLKSELRFAKNFMQKKDKQLQIILLQMFQNIRNSSWSNMYLD